MSTALDFGAALAAAKREARKQRAANPPPPPTAAVAVPPPLPAAPPTIRYAAEFVDEREARALATALRRLDGWAQLPRRRETPPRQPSASCMGRRPRTRCSAARRRRVRSS